jgi:hypothetical protein
VATIMACSLSRRFWIACGGAPTISDASFGHGAL